MMNNLLCKTFVMGALICSTQLSAQKVNPISNPGRCVW